MSALADVRANMSALADTCATRTTASLRCVRLGVWPCLPSNITSIQLSEVVRMNIRYCTSKFKLIISFLTKNKRLQIVVLTQYMYWLTYAVKHNVLNILRNSYNTKTTVAARPKGAGVSFSNTISIAAPIESKHHINRAGIEKNANFL